MKLPIQLEKRDVTLAVANVLLRLGKNDWLGAGEQLGYATLVLNTWLEQERQRGTHKSGKDKV